MTKFKSLRVFEEDGVFVLRVVDREFSDLPQGEVLIKVMYSGINYKDLLSSSGNKGVTRSYPHTPGIDASGVVVSDDTGRFQPNQPVVVMGYDLGMNTDGGFGGYIRVPADWVVALPANFSLREAMCLGTSGFTAALGVYKMIKMGQSPAKGPLVVSGATGGVGSFALQILSSLGFEIWAVSGKSQVDYLNLMGASKILTREDVLDLSGKPLLRPRWAGAFDTVGGDMLVSLLKQCAKSGSVATCGNVGGMNINMTVLPFILNGVNLLGINAADTPMDERLVIWEMLSSSWKPKLLEDSITEINLEGVEAALDSMRESSHKGRFLIVHNH
ncbi:MAG: YhdH/YhfP family quinone oxidoreductase [Bacteroidales bacterium]